MYALSLENLQHILSILKLSCISTIPLNGQNSYNLQKKLLYWESLRLIHNPFKEPSWGQCMLGTSIPVILVGQRHFMNIF